MLIIKKKNVLHELAVCLYLMLEFDPDTTAVSVTQRIKKRSQAALEDAKTYTGTIGEAEAQQFLNSPIYNFTIDCGTDIVKGDIIRFVEQVFDNRRRPPREIGKRGIIAEVISVKPRPKNPILYLRIISSGGVWNIKPGTKIIRTLKIITRTEVMRTPWPDEAQRNNRAEDDGALLQITSAKYQILKQHDFSKNR